MELHFSFQGKSLCADLLSGHDLSIPISPRGPRAWYVPPVRIAPVLNQYFTGSVKLGGKVNFNDIFFNPHGHGTHTETMGHITRQEVSIASFNRFFFPAFLTTIEPEIINEHVGSIQPGDRVIGDHQLRTALSGSVFAPEAVLIRTMPNDMTKCHRNYSMTNFPYMSHVAAQFLADAGVIHLLIDLPSVDREEDDGVLAAHHSFWKEGHVSRAQCTITEMIYVPNEVKDGNYLVQIVPAVFENDAAPSRIVLYPLR
jgi:kynurenine formamidase